MAAFSALLDVCDGNPTVTGRFPSQRPVTRNFDVFFICARTNGSASNRGTGDLRRHRADYDVTVMWVIGFIYGCPILYWIPKLDKWQSIWILVPTVATRWHVTNRVLFLLCFVVYHKQCTQSNICFSTCHVVEFYQQKILSHWDQIIHSFVH